MPVILVNIFHLQFYLFLSLVLKIWLTRLDHIFGEMFFRNLFLLVSNISYHKFFLMKFTCLYFRMAMRKIEKRTDGGKRLVGIKYSILDSFKYEVALLRQSTFKTKNCQIDIAYFPLNMWHWLISVKQSLKVDEISLFRIFWLLNFLDYCWVTQNGRVKNRDFLKAVAWF